jgi:hypothetical protein
VLLKGTRSTHSASFNARVTQLILYHPDATVVEEDQEGKIPRTIKGSTIGLPKEYLDLFRLQVSNESDPLFLQGYTRLAHRIYKSYVEYERCFTNEIQSS